MKLPAGEYLVRCVEPLKIPTPEARQGNNTHLDIYGGVTAMPSPDYFEELYGVTEERALNFWVSHLQETIGSKRWAQIRDSTGVYLASVMGHFCLQSMDRLAILSPEYSCSESDFCQFADLTQIAEMMLQQLTSAKNPMWMESAGAHILLYAGFFQSQTRHRHNIEFFE